MIPLTLLPATSAATCQQCHALTRWVLEGERFCTVHLLAYLTELAAPLRLTIPPRIRR